MKDLTYIPNVRESGDEAENFVEWEGPGELLNDTDQPIRERMLDVIIPLEESMSASEFAELVGCDTETARDYLEWFVSMGVVLKHPSYSDTRPLEYERTLTTAMEARRTESE
jgi:hypothetical protein